MIEHRPGAERGHANHGWLDTYHSFSFADYQDSRHMGFGPLRVINEDRVSAGKGFGTHGHRNMEIITYVLEGELAHKDSMGNGSVIRPDDVQRMSAGTGVRHSEFNHSADQPTHLLQIWIEPNVQDVAPGYEEKHFEPSEKRGQLRLIASPDGAAGSVMLHQEARLYAGLFDGKESAALEVLASRRAYVHVARGRIKVNGNVLNAGDAIKCIGESPIVLTEGEGAEVLVFDLP